MPNVHTKSSAQAVSVGLRNTPALPNTRNTESFICVSTDLMTPLGQERNRHERKGKGKGKKVAIYRPTKDTKVWWYDFIFEGQRVRESSKSRSKEGLRRCMIFEGRKGSCMVLR